MNPLYPIGGLFGLGAPELTVVLVILMVVLSGRGKLIGSNGGAWHDRDSRLTPHELRLLIVLGAVAAVGLGLLVWQAIMH